VWNRIIKGTLPLFLCTVFLSACQSDEQSLGEGTVVGNDSKVLLAEETNMLTLAPDEAKLYEQIRKTGNADVLKQADPILAAKLYIHAVLSGQYDTQYALMIPDSQKAAWSKAEYLKKMKSEGPKEAAELKRLFAQVQEVKFIETDERSGYLEFTLKGEKQGKFLLSKDAKGIWKAEFNPVRQ
jgi:hypothetical protein